MLCWRGRGWSRRTKFLEERHTDTHGEMHIKKHLVKAELAAHTASAARDEICKLAEAHPALACRSMMTAKTIPTVEFFPHRQPQHQHHRSAMLLSIGIRMHWPDTKSEEHVMQPSKS